MTKTQSRKTSSATKIEVIATEKITEPNFMGKKTWVHARKGERGTIIFVEPDGAPLVRFHRSGTAVAVDLGGDAVLAPMICAE